MAHHAAGRNRLGGGSAAALGCAAGTGDSGCGDSHNLGNADNGSCSTHDLHDAVLIEGRELEGKCLGGDVGPERTAKHLKTLGEIGEELHGFIVTATSDIRTKIRVI